jgi:predicted transcriptional regulator
MPDRSRGTEQTALDLREITAEVVEAYVARNPLPADKLPALIASVHGALSALGKPSAADLEPPVPPVPIRKTVTPDYLISLEDGRQYRTLRRHLSSRGLTPEAYRARWGLPPDYPMTAANYRERRSELARSLGLGRPRKPRD